MFFFPTPPEKYTKSSNWIPMSPGPKSGWKFQKILFQRVRKNFQRATIFFTLPSLAKFFWKNGSPKRFPRVSQILQHLFTARQKKRFGCATHFNPLSVWWGTVKINTLNKGHDIQTNIYIICVLHIYIYICICYIYIHIRPSWTTFIKTFRPSEMPIPFTKS